MKIKVKIKIKAKIKVKAKIKIAFMAPRCLGIHPATSAFVSSKNKQSGRAYQLVVLTPHNLSSLSALCYVIHVTYTLTRTKSKARPCRLNALSCRD